MGGNKLPAFYHDRNSPPGLNGHSTVKPVLPPTLWEELVAEEEESTEPV